MLAKTTRPLCDEASRTLKMRIGDVSGTRMCFLFFITPLVAASNPYTTSCATRLAAPWPRGPDAGHGLPHGGARDLWRRAVPQRDMAPQHDPVHDPRRRRRRQAEALPGPAPISGASRPARVPRHACRARQGPRAGRRRCRQAPPPEAACRRGGSVGAAIRRRH